jgi:glycogen debranching enzyme
MIKYFAVLVLLFWGLGCKSDPYESLPVIKLQEFKNRQFTFTNKISGFYLGNSHQENNSGYSGWTVNDFHYLKDYRIFLGSKIVCRDSLQQFDYYPSSFIRNYKGAIKETFTLLDSINSIIWEFEGSADLMNISFQPQFHRDSVINGVALTPSSPKLILSPEELGVNETKSDLKWIGFNYLTIGKKKVVIIGALESDKNRLIHQLNSLSENFEEKKEKREHRIRSLLELNTTQTNMPVITEAIAWAQLSLDALLTRQRGHGIWAGLPWFNNYWGRDTFISLTGALLVNGKFNEARKVLESFSRFQLKNEEDTWDGRIPNRVTNDEIIYNTADGTWWFVRAAYEYFLYTGDTKFAQQFYPVIKRAIKGAIRHRLDENFFLLHDDADTWMDAKGPDGPWSPRGNRAIEIQSLWYTSLQIGSIFARMNDEDQLGEHWQAISHTLKNNFSKAYWSPVRQRAYDHLNKDGMPDRKIRPNQILAIYVPDLPGLEPLFGEEKCARITSNVVHKLTYRYGVASLWQEDENFHPWHIYPSYYHKDEAYHNGTVWSWLAGPVISSMMIFNQNELAFNLYYDQAIQILEDDAIGNLAELRDALPHKELREPLVSGTVSQAWSLAEFVRNFYQDFIGFRPNALVNKINFSPNLPRDLSYISTRLSYANNYILFSYKKEEDIYSLGFKLEGAKNTVDVIFQFPGYEPVDFRLNEDNPSYELVLNSKNQKSYHSYTDLNWYFAQPELVEGLKTIQKMNEPQVAK